ncbi:hypothetical protein RchiOBHm_Chr4g0441401 [Rosa chinensis]|uniref:Uncharacterized protein n=1 Tax=Rosa chinensis TaxID=74649 RepID=A0A2P6R399_ROSCH|nr:hypothetical protein RchiOBHm_Chr4g0441401 [Rosa chinensis]
MNQLYFKKKIITLYPFREDASITFPFYPFSSSHSLMCVYCIIASCCIIAFNNIVLILVSKSCKGSNNIIVVLL